MNKFSTYDIVTVKGYAGKWVVNYYILLNSGNYEYYLTCLDDSSKIISALETDVSASISKNKFNIGDSVTHRLMGSDILEVTGVPGLMVGYELKHPNGGIYYALGDDLTLVGIKVMGWNVTSNQITTTTTNPSFAFSVPKGFSVDWSKLNEINHSIINIVKPKCTCGATKCGSSMHSDWCDLKERIS